MSLTRSTTGLILVSQLAVTCLASLSLLGSGNEAAKSVLLGGLICILPNAYLAFKLNSKKHAANPNKFVSTLFAAEAGKIVLTGALFAIVFATQKWILPLVLMGGFVLAQITHWLVPVISDVMKKHK